MKEKKVRASTQKPRKKEYSNVNVDHPTLQRLHYLSTAADLHVKTVVHLMADAAVEWIEARVARAPGDFDGLAQAKLDAWTELLALLQRRPTAK